MSKYGFDYFNKRIDIISEAGAKDKLFEKEFGQVSNLKDKAIQLRSAVSNLMARGNLVDSNGDVVPGLPQNIRTNRTLRYFLYMLTKMNELQPYEYDHTQDASTEDIQKRSNEEITAKAMDVVGIPDGESWRAYFKDPDKLYRKASVVAIKENPDYVLSPEFEKVLLNTTNIADYIRRGRTAQHSNLSIKKAKDLEELHGTSIENIHGSEMNIKELVSNIHRAMAYKRRKKTPNVPTETQPKIVDNFVNNITNILKSIEDWTTVKGALDKITNGLGLQIAAEDNEEVLRKMIQFNDNVFENPLQAHEIASLLVLPRDKTGNSLLEDLYEQFIDLKDTGVSMEEFTKEIEDMKSYLPEETHPVLDLILKDVNSNVSSDVSSEFAGYDKDVLKKFITTPEQLDGFRRYYKWKMADLDGKIAANRSKLEGLKSSFQDYPGDLTELRRNFAAFVQKWKMINSQRSKDYANSLKVPDEDPLLKQYGLEPEDIGDDYMSSKVKEAKPYGESYVMNYMTEQVSKDRFKPKGEFKDRGFKKPVNYSHWLDINS